MTRKAALEAALTEARAAEPMMTGNPFAWARKRTSEPVNPTMTRDELVAAAESIGMRFSAPSPSEAAEPLLGAAKRAVAEWLRMEQCPVPMMMAMGDLEHALAAKPREGSELPDPALPQYVTDTLFKAQMALSWCGGVVQARALHADALRHIKAVLAQYAAAQEQRHD